MKFDKDDIIFLVIGVILALLFQSFSKEDVSEENVLKKAKEMDTDNFNELLNYIEKECVAEGNSINCR